MKYIGVDKSGNIWAFANKPVWTDNIIWNWGGFSEQIPSGILPSLKPCCLYRIDKDYYVMIEDRR